MLLSDLIKQFNIAANTAFNKGYMELEPALKVLVYRFNSGAVGVTKFPITKIMSKISKFTGNRKHNTPADAFMVSVENEEFDGSIDIPRRDMLRAQLANSIAGLDIYVKEISSLGEEAKDHPMEGFLDMIEQGHTSTYGVCFDQQNLFDTTHAFDNKAGSQSNIVTGGGITKALVSADLVKVFTAIRGFNYSMTDDAGNSKKRKLNKTVKLDILCPDSMIETFEAINTSEYISDGVTNTMKGRLGNITGRPLTDTNDWFAFEVSEANVRPFIHSVEEEAKLTSPMAADAQMLEHKILTWGIEGFSYGKAYGAWWKAAKVTNS